MDRGAVPVVAVVGAGFAGLAAAERLHREGGGRISVVVLEAARRVGGRAQARRLEPTVFGEAAAPDGAPRLRMEMGPEFVHGEAGNAVADLLKRDDVRRALPGVGLVEVAWPNYVYLGKEGRLTGGGGDGGGENPVEALEELFFKIGESRPDELRERSVLEWMVERGLGSRYLDLADAIFANDYGGDLSGLSLREVCVEQHNWTYGEKYLLVDGGARLDDVAGVVAAGLPDVRLGWRVASVDWAAGGRATLRSADGRELVADRVVVTVPVPLLARGPEAAPVFRPPLPRAKAEAAARLRMVNAVKVFVTFSRRFWPADFWDCVCADCFLPELWLTPPALHAGGAGRATYTVVGFVTGERADRVAALPDGTVVHRFLMQLDAMFGSLPGAAHPATDAFVEGAVQNWAAEPLALGAYTAPSLGAHGAGARGELAAPVGGVLFFAGEATHPGVNPCMQGAFETGVRVAREVADSLAARPRL